MLPSKYTQYVNTVISTYIHICIHAPVSHWGEAEQRRGARPAFNRELVQHSGDAGCRSRGLVKPHTSPFFLLPAQSNLCKVSIRPMLI